MKRVVKLTETDLNRLVKKVLKEYFEFDVGDFDSSEKPKKLGFKKPPRPPFARNPRSGNWYDADDTQIDEPTDYKEEGYFGVGEFARFKKFIKNCDTAWCLNVKMWFDKNAKDGDIVVRQ